MKIRSLLVSSSLLLLVASICWAQTVSEYSLPVDPFVYGTNGFDSRVLPAPTHGGAVVFYNYEGGNDGSLYRWYIKSLVVDKNGIPGPATTLVKGDWFHDAGAPPSENNLRTHWNHPRITDVIWNGDRNGFDLFYTVFADPLRFKLCMMPLDDCGQPAGKAARILVFDDIARSEDDSGSDYNDFMASRIFLAGPGGSRVLLTVNQSTFEIRLRQFKSNGRTTLEREDILGDKGRKGKQAVIAFTNYSPVYYCLYSRSFSATTGKSGPVFVDIIDARTLGFVPGMKNFKLKTVYDQAVFANDTHLFYGLNWKGPGSKYYAAYRTIGAKKSQESPPHSFPIGDRGEIIAAQSVKNSQNGKTHFDIFTYKGNDPYDNGGIYSYPFYLTRINTNGKIVVQKQRVFETTHSNNGTKHYQITETSNGTVIYVYYNYLLVSQPN